MDGGTDLMTGAPLPAPGCPAQGPAIFTFGHSTRPIETTLNLLRMNSVGLVADVRTVPRSRHNPQYNREALATALVSAGIEYVHEAELGGLRRPRADSINAAWRNDSFRGFADHMQTPQFNHALDELLGCCRRRRFALMCAEGNPFRCHRSLIADAILVRGLVCCELGANGRPRPHRLTAFAKVRGEAVWYPAEPTGMEPPPAGG